MFKKVISLGVILIMLFSFTACDNSLEQYKANAKLEIKTYAEDKGQDNYSTENWAVIEGLVAKCKTAIDAAAEKVGVDNTVKAVKTAINAVEEGEMRDLVLTISTEKTTLSQGENFIVNVELKNNSEQDLEIIFNYGFIAHIPSFIDFFDPSNPAGEMPEPQTLLLETDDILQNIGFWGTQEQYGILITNHLSSGTHEICFHFAFNFEGKSVRIWSNKITLTVQ